jgi:hypothetical protein
MILYAILVLIFPWEQKVKIKAEQNHPHPASPLARGRLGG